jgi:hypothetical protein
MPDPVVPFSSGASKMSGTEWCCHQSTVSHQYYIKTSWSYIPLKGGSEGHQSVFHMFYCVEIDSPPTATPALGCIIMDRQLQFQRVYSRTHFLLQVVLHFIPVASSIGVCTSDPGSLRHQLLMPVELPL